MTDYIILGPVVFGQGDDNFSTPERIGSGGRQAMAVHKLLGGRRVIDTLGPDDADICWHGQFFGNGALATCLELDALRAQGSPLPLSFAGQGFVVVIAEFHYDIRQMPVWVEYTITCTISQNGAQGSLASAVVGVDTLVTSDLGAAISLVG